MQATAIAGTNTLTLPATTSDTLVGKATTDVLTNKTLTAPVIASISNSGTITGSQAGAWPSFVPNTNYTVGLVVNVTQSWSGSNTTPLGIVPYIHNTNDEFFNGEFSGSEYIVTDGVLNNQQFLDANAISAEYSMYPYFSRYVDGLPNNPFLFAPFINPYTSPRSGEFLMHVSESFITATSTTYTFITHLKIARIDQNGVDNTFSLQSLEKIIWEDSTADKIILDITSISEYQDYYLYEVSSKTWINLPFYILLSSNLLMMRFVLFAVVNS